jgi:hypothetical protein
VLLFQKRFHAGLVAGAITLTVRAWKTPRVKPGGRYRVHPIGVVEVDALEEVTVSALSEQDAQRSGFASRAELLAYLAPVVEAKLTARTRVFRVTLHHGGDGDRVPLALEATLTGDDVRALTERLARFDTPTRWTKKTFALIAAHPRTAASKLAPRLKLPTAEFKARVVKLKKLGLTQSFEVGYELSPRGRAYLAALAQGAGRAKKPPTTTRRAAPGSQGVRP